MACFQFVNSSDSPIWNQEEMLNKLEEQMDMEKHETVKVESIEQQINVSNHTLNKVSLSDL